MFCYSEIGNSEQKVQNQWNKPNIVNFERKSHMGISFKKAQKHQKKKYFAYIVQISEIGFKHNLRHL